mmetsp:Transcript_55441/g.60062  ORF Transcript_55441/g.60062 Transcript_55441/m.60062 type:complete len:317 (-) Transcript_55441:227-1177(-)
MLNPDLTHPPAGVSKRHSSSHILAYRPVACIDTSDIDERDQSQQRNLKVNPAITTITEGDFGTFDWRVSFAERNKGVMSPWHDIPLAAESDGLYNLVIEMPKRTTEKMEMNKWEENNPIYQDIKNGELRHYPNMLYWNYGFLPQTYESPYRTQSICEIESIVGDNDPVDVLEISNTTFGIGEILQVKILGGMPNIDDFEEIDWKLIAVAKGTPEFDEWNDITDVPAYILSGVMEWYRWKKYYKNELQYFACNDTFLDANYMKEVVLPKTHDFWKELIKGELPVEDPPIFYTAKQELVDVEGGNLPADEDPLKWYSN